MKKVNKKLSLNKNVVTQLNNVKGGDDDFAPTKGTACTLVSCAGGMTCVSCAYTCGNTCQQQSCIFGGTFCL